MQEVWIPVYNNKYSENEKQLLLRELKKAKPDIVLLVFHRILCNEERLQSEYDKFMENKNFLTENGFEVGAWVAPTIGYGSDFFGDHNAKYEYTYIHRLCADIDVPGAYCPSDNNFVDGFLNTLRYVTRTGVSIIMFEDDFTLGGGKFLHDIGCACDKHMDEYCRRIGEKITRKELSEKIFGGGKNKYRDLFIQIQRETLTEFCQKIEKTVHEINPEVRIGLSANGSSYEMEGAPVHELEKVIAGNKKGFIRLTGAPYWTHTATLAAPLEATRVQTAWCADNNIDLMAEGDTYPRPRHWVPASYLEIFDMILRADSSTNSILKYMIDYTSDADYETGYIQMHTENEPHYKEIERRFSGKKTVGINLFENHSTLTDRVFDDIPLEKYARDGYQPLASQRLLTDCCVPIAYGSDDYPIFASGENTRYLTEEQMKKGIITDIIGAKRLMERGVDIGIESLERIATPTIQRFNLQNRIRKTAFPNESIVYGVKLKHGAISDSDYLVNLNASILCADIDDTKNCISYPACIRYENKQGMRFMIYTVVLESVMIVDEWCPGIFRDYCFQKQIIDGVEWLGKALPAVCPQNPDLYILCKEDENSLSVGLWNLFADETLNQTINLSGEYSRIDFYNCSGKLEKNIVTLNERIKPYSFVFFTVYK